MNQFERKTLKRVEAACKFIYGEKKGSAIYSRIQTCFDKELV